jgi:hypothetical protein
MYCFLCNNGQLLLLEADGDDFPVDNTFENTPSRSGMKFCLSFNFFSFYNYLTYLI